MAGLFNPADITWNGKEVETLNEIIIEKVFQKPSLTQIHALWTGIKAKQQIGYLSQLGLVGKKSAGCAPDTSTETVEGSEKFWDPEYIEDRFVQCWKDLIPSFWSWGLKNGVSKGELEQTDFMRFMRDVLSDAMYEAVLRIVWFSDEDAANYNSSPAGFVKNGTNLAFFNPIEGIWKQIFDIVATTSARKTTTLTTKNAQATYADQAFNSTDTTNKIATSTLEALKYEADFRLRGATGLKFYVTQSLADQYAKELRSQNLDMSYERIEGGYDQLYFEGIPVIPLQFWDRIIRQYFDNGTKYYLPHRAILVDTDNIAVGTEEESNLQELKVWHENKDNSLYIDFGFNLDAKVIEDYMIQVAY